MSRTFRRRLAAVAVVVFVSAVAGCGSDSDEPDASAAVSTAGVVDTASTATDAATDTTPSATDAVSVPATRASADTATRAPADTATAGDGPVAPVTELADGPVTVVSLGDSLTAGQGDEDGQGYVGDLTALIGAAPGRSGSTLVNLGMSGWDSTMMVEGGWDGPSQLDAAVAETTAAVAAGSPVLATVLIGSNDMWYLYDGSGDEDAAAEVYRANLERTVRELTEAGAVVVVGLPNDPSLLLATQDIEYLHNYLPNVTEEEVDLMSAMSDRLGSIAAEIAAEYGARIVDTESPLWADAAMLDPDLIHPNSVGYAALAEIWFAEIEPLI
jgi:lysophospholipase L1-like esterase